MFIKHRWLLGLFFVPLVVLGNDGDRQGNGGDDVRAAFFRVGNAVLAYLNDSEAGRRLVADQRLTLKELERTLTIKVVTVTESDLYDGSGRKVDSTATHGSIQLRKKPWFEAFAADADVYSTVFHLMLKAAGEADEGRRVSRAIDPFPPAFKVSTKVDFAKATSGLSHQERHAYLTKRGQLLAIRLAAQSRADLLDRLAIPRRRLLFDVPSTVGPGAEGRWKAALDEIESTFNAIEGSSKP